MSPEADTTKDADDSPTEVLVRWPAEHDLPILVSNVFVLQGFDGGILLTFGQASPPLPSVAGEPEPEVTSVEARVLARLSVPAGRVPLLAHALGEAAEAIARGVADARSQPEEAT